MRSKFTWMLTLCLAFVFQFSFAQEKTVTGTVTDQDGLPLPGASIVVKGTSRGQQTDFDGNYSIRVSVGEILVYSYVGQKTVERTVGSANVINVQLDQDAQALEEVVVQGYRNATKERSSIASTTISAEKIELRPNASFAQTLSGQIPGLNITTNTGQPGGNSTINLRGITSINGNSEPLFIIDGAPVDEDNFRSLNPNEIASVSVLKDAGATAIYGNRGANGVIIVKTKKGSFNSGLKINYQGQVSFSELQDNDYDLTNAQEQLELERTLSRGVGNGLTDAEIAAFTTTRWEEVFFRTGISQNHTLSLSNGGDNVTSFTSFGYSDTEGILVQSSLKRFNVRSNITGKSNNDRFNYSTNLSLNYSESDEPNNIGGGAINRNLVLGAYQSVPYISPDEYTNGAALLSPLLFRNTPLFLLDIIETFTREEAEVRIIASANASYKITDDITASITASGDYTDEHLTRAEGPESFNALLFAQTGNNTPGFQDQNTTRTFSFNAVTSLNWNKTFGKHTVDASVFTEYFRAYLRTFGFFQRGLNPATFSPGDGAGFVADNAANDFFIDTARAQRRNAGLFSYFGQVDYDYDSKYGFTGTIRRDASYRFAASNRWGTFYSVAGRWNIHNEPFMEGSIFNLLKLRASYGETGNQRIVDAGAGALAFFAAPDLTENFFATGNGYGGANSLFLSQIGNNSLRWETVKQANVGIDFEVFDRRLRGSIDGYIRTTEDLFQDSPVSAITSQNVLRANVGSLENSGIDLTLNYDLIRGGAEGFNLSLNLVGNYNKSEIIDLPGGVESIRNANNNDLQLRVGGPINEVTVYRFIGVNPDNGNLLFLDANGNETENPTDNDRINTGKNIVPDYQGSFGFNADYKGFFLTTQFNYVIGVDRFDFDLRGFQNPNNIGQFRATRDLFRAWQNPGDITDIPSLTVTNRVLGNDSDRDLYSSDYLRLRFASFGYNFPAKFLENTGLTSFRAFVNGENLFTVTDWRGFDAEASFSGSRQFPTPRIFSVGVEFGF
ncbi:SusC/RagA family TonB-linked outer membrane protein [Leptobacterium flavescens]|uniref:SusC/RagA family TonB-linked outer membrane protein n=1 Tax=Leptobacterium flavescens TaxID=472055 RepID=A0A6P0UR11_9FLAO|nr:TonB-dependent receptor [Leptobacterium flavescens]NER14972.1 SusC/RagA family TonB-linked outer membrane protein [Leptobacterium flavescens]